MTSEELEPGCACPSVPDLVRGVLHGAETPSCTAHRPEPTADSPDLALNSAALLTRALHAHPRTETTP